MSFAPPSCSARLAAGARARARCARATVALVAISCIVAWSAAPASAARSGSGAHGKQPPSSSTIALVLLDSSDGVPHWGQSIRFSVKTDSAEPHVDLSCTQAGSLVYFAQTGYYDGYAWPWTQTFTLSSGAWSGGPADCTAELYSFNGRKTLTEATMAFHVLG